MHRRQALKLFAGFALCPLCAPATFATEHHWSYGGEAGPDKYDLQHELHVAEHDVGGAGGDRIEVLPVLLARLDLALFELAADLVRVDDEAAAMDTGEFGEIDLLCAPAPHKHLIALIGIGRPGAGELSSIGALRQQGGHQYAGSQNLSNRFHMSFP